MDEILLTIQIGGFDHVKINKNKGSHAYASQGNGYRRPEAAQPGDPNDRSLYFFVDPRGMSREEETFKFFGRGAFTLLNEDDLVSSREGVIRGEGETIIDDDVGLRL